MSMSRKALKLAHKSLPCLALCGDKLVLPPTEHIVRGFMFERTPYKEKFYLWRWVTPLFRVTLNYSKRIPKGDCIHLSKDHTNETAATIAKIISDDVPILDKIRAPCDFLGHIGWMIGNDSPNFLFDLGVTYFMTGRHDEAAVTLGKAVAEAEKTIAGFKQKDRPDSPVIPKMDGLRQTAHDLAAAIRLDPAAAAQIVSEWERRNIERFDLTDTVLESATPSTSAVQPGPTACISGVDIPSPPQPSDTNSRSRR